MPKYEFVAVDFDGTLCADAFPEVGAPNRAVIGYVKRLAADGSKIILYTSRENGTRKLLDEAVAFCKEQEIPLYAVNENPGNPHAAKIGLKPSDGRKVYADLCLNRFQRKINLAVCDGIVLFRNGFLVLFRVKHVHQHNGGNAVKLELRIDHFAKRVFLPIVGESERGNRFLVGVAHNGVVYRPTDGMYRGRAHNERNPGIRFNRGRNRRVNLPRRYAVIVVRHGLHFPRSCRRGGPRFHRHRGQIQR